MQEEVDTLVSDIETLGALLQAETEDVGAHEVPVGVGAHNSSSVANSNEKSGLHGSTQHHFLLPAV